MPKVVFYDCSDQDVEYLSQRLGEAIESVFVNEPISLDNLVEDCDAISVFVNSIVDEGVISRLPNLKLIACRSTGFNNIDLEFAGKTGVAIANVPAYGGEAVAEYTMGLILALVKKLPQSMGAPKSNPSLEGLNLKGKTLGVVGLGSIGAEVARLGRSFGMEVITTDPFVKGDTENAQLVDLNDLLKSSNILTLHAPYTGDNRHMINAETLNITRDGVYIINTARGELVNTADLVAALESGKVAGAALDVLDGIEALTGMATDGGIVPEDTQEMIKKLHLMPNVILTPHNAFNSQEAVARINDVAADNIVSFFAGNPTNIIRFTPR